MKTEKIYDENGKSFFRIFSSDEVEKVNPVEYYKTFETKKRAISLRDILAAKYPYLTSSLDDKFFMKNAEETLVGFFEKFEKTEVHANIIKVLETSRKKDQEALLKGMSLDPDQLMSLIFQSYNKFGYLYSRYRFENLPTKFEGRKLPKVFRLKEDGSIERIGETDLSDGELKNIMDQRSVVVSHFFEKDDVWHCFFLTYNSIGGKENYNEGQPHFHYISSGFNISKQEFVDSMKTGKYRSTSIHIDLLDYGVQPK